MDTEIEISEKEYLEQYIAINLSYRKIVCEALLKSYDLGNEAIKKSLGVEMLYQYIGMLEDLLMVYFALKDKNDRGSLINGLLEINIKEDSKYSTETLIKDIEEIDDSNIREFLRLLNLPNDDEILGLMTLTQKERENPESLKTQYISEIIQAFKMLKKVISNRILTNDGRELPLYKVANKIKHGNVMIHTYKQDPAVYMPFRVMDNKRELIKLGGYFVYFKDKDTLIKLRDNMEKVGEVIASLLNIYLAYNYKN
jgi:hypothetical protein